MSVNLPPSMCGVVVQETGAPDVLQYKSDLPLPVLLPHQVLIKNDLVGVNFIDTYFRSGLYMTSMPEIIGREGAGIVVARGKDVTIDVSELNIGDRVVWRGVNGGYAEYSAADASKVLTIPAGLSTDIACAALLQGLTAITLVEEACTLVPGDWVHVTAASGGTGGLLCQALKSKGVRTIATVGTNAKKARAESLGPEVVLVEDELGDDGIRDAVLTHTGGDGVKVVFDGIGQATFDRSLSLVCRKGSMISYGNASGPVKPLSISRLAENNVKVLRPVMDKYLVTREENQRHTANLLSQITKHNWSIMIHKIYPMSEAAQAHRDLEGRSTQGKLLLRP